MLTYEIIKTITIVLKCFADRKKRKIEGVFYVTLRLAMKMNNCNNNRFMTTLNRLFGVKKTVKLNWNIAPP